MIEINRGNQNLGLTPIIKDFYEKKSKIYSDSINQEILVSIIILNWNKKDLTRNCLNSILKNTEYPYYEIIVVDNGSNDGSPQMIKNEYPMVKLIENKRNLGFSKGNNIGIKYSKGDYIFLLNNDTEVTNNWLNSAVKVANSSSKIGIVGCKLLFPDGKIQHAGGWMDERAMGHLYGYGEVDKGQYNKIYEVEFVSGAAMLIKKEVIDKIGLLDEGFSPAYKEKSRNGIYNEKKLIEVYIFKFFQENHFHTRIKRNKRIIFFYN